MLSFDLQKLLSGRICFCCYLEVWAYVLPCVWNQVSSCCLFSVVVNFIMVYISFWLNEFEGVKCKLLETFCSPDMHSSLDQCLVAVHEYRIPPKALFGLHSYCPIHFDSSHAVLVDTSVHISLLRTDFHRPQLKAPRFVRFQFLKLRRQWYLITVSCIFVVYSVLLLFFSYTMQF